MRRFSRALSQQLGGKSKIYQFIVGFHSIKSDQFNIFFNAVKEKLHTYKQELTFRYTDALTASLLNELGDRKSTDKRGQAWYELGAKFLAMNDSLDLSDSDRKSILTRAYLGFYFAAEYGSPDAFVAMSELHNREDTLLKNLFSNIRSNASKLSEASAQVFNASEQTVPFILLKSAFDLYVTSGKRVDAEHTLAKMKVLLRNISGLDDVKHTGEVLRVCTEKLKCMPLAVPPSALEEDAVVFSDTDEKQKSSPLVTAATKRAQALFSQPAFFNELQAKLEGLKQDENSCPISNNV